MSEISDHWIDKADDGDGQYAIAIALCRVAAAIDRLGTANAATPMGALEMVAFELSKIGPALAAISDTIREMET
jgi:hypothetical protein